jgi:ent-kaurene oxidase
MVARFSSISTRKISMALSIITSDKCMVATSDYDDFHKTVKRHLIKNVLGPNAQKRHRSHRDTLMANIVKDFHAHVKDYGLQPVNFREIFQSELFGLAMKETVGSDVQALNVEEVGRLSRRDIFRVLMEDPVEVALDVDWKDFFTYLKWIPNSNFERKIKKMDFRRLAVMKAFIKEKSKRFASGEDRLYHEI